MRAATFSLFVCTFLFACGARSGVLFDSDDAGFADGTTGRTDAGVRDTPRVDTPSPMVDSGAPSCASEDSNATLLWTTIDIPSEWKHGFADALTDMGKCGPEIYLWFHSENCIDDQADVRITFRPDTEGGGFALGRYTAQIEGLPRFNTATVELFRADAPRPGGRITGTIEAQEEGGMAPYGLTGEFDLTYTLDLVPDPFCA